MFARAEVIVEPFDRLSHVSWVGEDGSRQLAPWLVDTSSGEDRWVHELEPNRAWCLPASIGFAQAVWLDALCTEPALRTSGPAFHLIADAPTVCANNARMYESGVGTGPVIGCDGPRWDFRAYDVPIAGPVWEWTPDGTCTPVDPGVTLRESDGAVVGATLSVVRNVRR